MLIPNELRQPGRFIVFVHPTAFRMPNTDCAYESTGLSVLGEAQRMSQKVLAALGKGVTWIVKQGAI